jgi:hypothetical protein
MFANYGKGCQSKNVPTGNLGRKLLRVFGKYIETRVKRYCGFSRCCVPRWKTANCTEEDLTDDKNALENMKIKIDAL